MPPKWCSFTQSCPKQLAEWCLELLAEVRRDLWQEWAADGGRQKQIRTEKARATSVPAGRQLD